MFSATNRENGCSQKDYAENSVALQKTSRNVAFIKSSKNLRDSPQTSRKPLSHAISMETAQFHGTQTKTCFSCNKAKRSVF